MNFTCPKCGCSYESDTARCPYCGFEPKKAKKKSEESVATAVIAFVTVGAFALFVVLCGVGVNELTALKAILTLLFPPLWWWI